MTAVSAPSSPTVRAWDLPTRLFKWTLVLLVVMAPISKNFGDVTLAWHKMNGYAILTLLLWRLMWGFAGSTTARFTSFLTWPTTALNYAGTLFAKGRRYLGHNPLGGWMVIALMGILALQGFTGLFVSDDIIVEGPLYNYGSSTWLKLAKVYHKSLFPLILLLAAIHIIANVLYTLVKKEPLIPAMVTGRKPADDYVDAPNSEGGSPILALVLLVLSVVVVWGGVYVAAGAGAFR